MARYLRSSRKGIYGLLLTLPLLIIYGTGVHVLFRHSTYEMRNTGDVMVRQIGGWLHLQNPWLVSALLILVFGLYMFWSYRQEELPRIRSIYFPAMLVESLVWGSLLFILLTLLANLPLQLGSFRDQLAQYNLALGAGIYEELVFRAVLISAFGSFLMQAAGLQRTWALGFSLVLAAAVFASFHLFLESFELRIYAQRFMGGVLLGLLYLGRGYGVAVYSHVTYNLLTLVLTR